MRAPKAANIISLKGTVIWFTGLSGAGKTTLAVALKKNGNQEVRLFICLMEINYAKV
ncbi:MAG: adenylyl-sulfate kinase [Cytophagales bacterium]|nr:adenylyl-sulfate kinase [Cytophagales bacterium]